MQSMAPRPKKKAAVSGDFVVSLLVDVHLGRLKMRQAAAAATLSKSSMYSFKKKGIVPKKIIRGRKPVFTEKQEGQLKEWLLSRSRRFDCATLTELRRMAFLLAVSNNIKHPFKTGKAGRAWSRGFLKRNGLKMKNAVMISKDRAFGLTKEVVNDFFDVLEKAVEDYNIKPQHIFNMDESGFKLVRETRLRVVAEAERRHPYRIKAKERSPLVTVVAAMNPLGFFVPPAFILRPSFWVDGCDAESPPGTIVMFSPKGWMMGSTFQTWVAHFNRSVQREEDEWVLLVLDGHTSHVNQVARSYCLEHKILLLTLPAHTSHRMQPLDVSFFGPLKGYYVTSLDEFINVHGNVAPHQILRIAAEPYQKAATAKNAKSGFRKTGIWDPTLERPNRAAYTDMDFMQI